MHTNAGYGIIIDMGVVCWGIEPPQVTGRSNNRGGLVVKGDKLAACEANQEATARVELKVNGNQIELNNFVQNFITKSVIGMVKSLRGVSEIETISLDISKKTGPTVAR